MVRSLILPRRWPAVWIAAFALSGGTARAQDDAPPESEAPAEPAEAPPPAETPAPEPETVPAAQMGTLEVRVKDEVGDIYIDGEKVGSGSFKGELPAGEHGLKVTREGYDAFSKTVVVVAGQVVSETVALRRNVAGDELADFDEGDWSFDGLYGGIQLHGMFLPGNSGHTLDGGCDTIGATACEAGTPAGGGIAGYIGYAFAPLGFELLLLAGGDVVSPSASFDGTTGSDINPLVAAPGRTEDFTIGRFGGGGALRLRVLVPIDRFRITGALGAGAAYRFLLLGRDTMAEDGASSTTSDDGTGYVTPVLSVEVAGQVRLAGTTALAVGFNLWLEHAGSDVMTAPKPDARLTGGAGLPRPLNTPSYDMAVGTQVFIGPFLGLQFGP